MTPTQIVLWSKQKINSRGIATMISHWQKLQSIEPNTRSIQFIEDGFYQFAYTEFSYVIYKYPSSETPAFETIYDLPFIEIPNFYIRSFEIAENELYLVGVNNENGFGFHYVQKRTIGQAFEPTRADLSIDTFSVVKIIEPIWDTHDYSCTVRNNGSNTINGFAISSPNLPIFHHDYSYIRDHFDINLEPGETYTFSGTANLITDPSQLTIKITGVNYAFDGNNANNEYTADVTSLSNSNIAKLDIDLYPNPSSDILNIKGDIDNQSTIVIYDTNGQIVSFDRIAFDRLDISQLQVGLYNLVITTKYNSLQTPFTKI